MEDHLANQPEPCAQVLPPRRVHEGGMHREVARRPGLSRLYDELRMHSVEGLNRLLCFCNFGDHGFRLSHFVVV